MLDRRLGGILIAACALALFLVPVGSQQALRRADPLLQEDPLAEEDQRRRHLSLNVQDLITKFQLARSQYEDQLKVQYGEESFQNLFTFEENGERISSGRAYHLPASGERNGVSRHRLQRKITMKILKHSIEGQVQPFVWATGGHSASAGHGNLFNESYTATLERNGQGIFDAVGMKLEGRNYAMGGTSSAWEIASCMEEIFGLDIDAISWDYGMVDGRDYSKMEYFFYRAGQHPNRPACFTGEVGGGGINVLKAMDAMGLPSFYRDAAFAKQVHGRLPDVSEMTSTEIEQLPTHVRGWRCGTQYEAGHPCIDYRWTKTDSQACEKRKFRVSWHPGWKHQAMEGNMFLITLVDVIDDALQSLAANSTDPAMLFKMLKEEENLDYKHFMDSPLPQHAQEKTTIPDVDIEVIYRQRSACHSARLPSQSRILGILTETTPGGPDDYYKGVSMRDAFDQPIEDGGQMVLAFKPEERQACEQKVQADYKDMFYTTMKSTGFSKLVLPNDAEKQAYGHSNLKGIIAICVSACGFGKCEEGCLEGKLFNTGKAGTLHVNGVPVVNMTEFSPDCSLLVGPTGHQWQPNSDGRFEIAVKADGHLKYIRFSAAVIW